MFGQWEPQAPGELMQVDSTPLDVLVLLDDGVPGRVELTGMIDVATRTVTAAVLRPSARSVDAGVLLARTLTPEPMRPGWAQALSMARSVLPFERLLSIDERMAHAAARPVIVPDTIVIDHGSVFVSANFRAACRHLGISIQPAHLASGAEKPHIERTFGSVASLFCEFVSGYAGRNPDRRGRGTADGPLWSMLELQELLDEWLIAAWQNRPHEELRDPAHPGRAFTPNEKYAALVEAAGYVPVALSADDYIELLPAEWRAVNAYGIKIRRRTYDSEDLNPLRQQPSGVREKKNLWEVRYDPYDVSKVFVRGPGRLDHLPVAVPGPGADAVRRAGLGPRPPQPGREGPDGHRGRDRRRGRRAADPRLPGPGAGSGPVEQAGPAGRRPHPRGHPARRPRNRAAAPRQRRQPGQPRRRRRGAPRGGDPDAAVRPVRRFRRPGGDARGRGAPGAARRGGHRHLTMLEGWRAFLGHDPGPPVLLPRSARKQMPEDDRLAYDEQRMEYHVRLGVIETPMLAEVLQAGRLLALLNREAVSARRGLIVSGPAGTGKTTAVTQLGKRHEITDQRRHPHARPGSRIPVVYVTVPPAATPRMLAAEFARFLGLPITARANITDIIEAVCGVLIDCRTSLVRLRRDQQPPHGHPRRRRGLRYPQVLLRADPRHVRLRRHRRRNARACSPGPAASRSPAGSP